MLEALRGWVGAVRASRLRLTIAGLGLFLAVAVPAQAVVRQTIENRVSAQHLTMLPHEVLGGLGKVQKLGRLAAGQKILVAITVKHDLNALYRAEDGLYNPKSSNYHHFLTPAQFQARFGTPASRLKAIRAFGTSHGLRLVNPGVLHDFVELWGTAAQVEATFHVQLDRFRAASGQPFFANLQNPRVPSGLGIAGVLGLESFSRYHLADMGPQSSVPTTQGGCNADPTGTANACTGLLSPQALWRAYQTPGAGQTTPDTTTDFGQGQSMGIIGEGQTVDVITALREFERTRGLPFVPVQVYHTDPGEQAAENTLDDSGRIEWEMDSQSSTGMAPEVSQLRMYFGSSLLLTELTGALGTWVNDTNGPLQASASLGACEDTPWEDPLLGVTQRADQAFLAQASMEGRTFFASAGDTGEGCPVLAATAVNGVTYHPNVAQGYPAIDPNTVAVGGTILYTNPNGSRQLERAWDHTGGGPSKFLPQMPWQQSSGSPLLASNVCPGVYADGSPFAGGGNLCRGGNDVAAESGDITISADHKAGDAAVGGGYNPTTQPVQANGFDMVDFCPDSEAASENPAQASCAYAGNGGSEAKPTTDGTAQSGVMTDHFSEGGTSLSSPLWLGMWTLVQAHHDAGNDPASSLGLASPLIYKLGANSTTDARDFSDVTLGANPLPAGPGWDYPSGWGSPNVTPLIEDASATPGSTAPASDVQPGTSDPTPIVAQAPSGGPSCNYVFYDPSADAPDGFTLQQDNQLDLVEGDLGLTPDQSKLRVVMTIKDLSKTIPTGSNYLDYEFFWTDPAGNKGPNAVDVQVDSSGNVTYADGTETVTTTQGTSNYSFTASKSSDATGTFTTGPGGKIEVDVPLSELGLKVGDVLTGTNAYTADGNNNPAQPFGFIADQDGPGNSYTLGQVTCIDQGAPPPPPPPPPPPAKVSLVGAPSSNGSGVVVKLQCTGATGQSCPTTEKLTTVETVKKGKVVAVSASGSGKGKRTVTVGSTNANVPAGSTVSVVVSLNSTGRSLLKQFHKLPVTLTVGLTSGQKTTTVATRTVTIKQKG